MTISLTLLIFLCGAWRFLNFKTLCCGYLDKPRAKVTSSLNTFDVLSKE